ncbi:aminotransferase [Campylobacter sp. MIT 99-7217]|uniref:aminotransferase class V-fold PLP-dependent enzyme n=1 Tax=Campylobacter sp. MIT 99-7217 TaxID=535091 RepID=UPI001157128B|nr:aminotransferase class V-fold PLP-dependent enzyme [Campylobacter sp. MIT 99-7217]TQR33001.1 aminotransferase [Campylobacter sp. MIT 99-7217]
MDIQNLKKDIILKKGLYYFDFAASALALKSVEKEIKKVLLTYANTHSDSSSSSFKTQQHYENARLSIKKSLGLNEDFALIACGTGSSGAIKKFQELLGIFAPPRLREKYCSNLDMKNLPLVIIGPYEHHSNELSFREGLCECVRIPLDEQGELDFKYLESILKANSKRQIIASISLASNVTGILTDFERLSKLVRKYKGIVAFDASSFAPYKNVPCKFYDALFISSHKFIGGVGGSGLLAVKKELCGSKPSFAAGGTVGYVSRSSVHYLLNEENLEEAGTPGILQLIRASLAFKIRDEIGLKFIEEKEEELKEYFFKQSAKIKDLNLYASNLTKRLPIFSFNIQGISPFDLAFVLSDKFGIQSRAGCACAGPYGHDLLGLKDDENLSFKPGWLRLSFHYTHEKADIDFVIKSINESIKKLKA